ncbi:MAG: ribosomal-processing cysteine protease Prp [Erysipelotrichaceae bacterium]|nr:ribosomal-processing cysteine protease Prp [Erysipelotrichaceae bacterium]
MTTYKVVYKINEAVIEVSGHADYAKHGSDIVCASISTACIITANLIDKLDLRYNILDLVCEEGYFRLQVNTQDETTLGIFENLVETLESISGQYPKHLKLKN